MKKITIIQLVLVTLLMCPIADADMACFEYLLTPLKFRSGDDPGWRLPDYDDRDWNFFYEDMEFAGTSDKYWLRGEVLINTHGNPLTGMGISMVMAATYEVYWNGVFIGNNCLHGNDIKAQNGRFLQIFQLPDSVKLSSTNTLAIRTLVREGMHPGLESFIIGNYEHLLSEPFNASLYPAIQMIIHLILCFYYLQWFKKNHLARYVFFGILLLSMAFQNCFYIGILNSDLVYDNIFTLDKIQDIRDTAVFVSSAVFLL